MDFLILPDNRAADPVHRELARADATVIRHASGRPWLAGLWPRGQIRVAARGNRRLAIIGPTQVDAEVLDGELARARSLRDLDSLARTLPGSFYLAASFDGITRSQGTVSTARQIFFAEAGGNTLAASGPAMLARFIGARLDPATLALRLLTPVAPWPLFLRPMWSGVRQLSVGCWLEVGRAGQSRSVRWWDPPDASIPLATAKDAIRDALRESVDVRTRGCDVIAADLSGGMDSASICFLAAGTGTRLLTYHWQPMDPGNDDSIWAGKAAEYIPDAEHRFLGVSDAPTWFAAQPDQGDAEGPPTWNRNRRHMEFITQQDASGGAGRHLTGLGGDELFGAIPGYLWSLFRERPLRSIPEINRYRVVNRWTLGSTARGLMDRTRFAMSLIAAADAITAPAPGPFDAQLGWRGQLRMPPWATRDAIETVRGLLREEAGRNPAPLDSDRAQHQVLESVVLSGTALRQLRTAFIRFGVEWDAPFLDDRVIETAMSVRIGDRMVPAHYKPVLSAAMRGVVPGAILNRRSKGEYSAEAFAGLRRNQRTLLDLCDDLRLARLGLVDADALRAALLALGPESRHLAPIETTLACELWIRSARAAAAAAAPSPGGS